MRNAQEVLAKALPHIEKITLKLLIDGKEIAEIEMDMPEQSSIYPDEIGWYRNTSPKVPCQPYKSKGEKKEIVSYYYPYHLMLSIGRKLRKEELKAFLDPKGENAEKDS